MISSLRALEILDSRGWPTIEVELRSRLGHVGRASVPSGASTGCHEAVERRDKRLSRYWGRGVQTVVETLESTIADHVCGRDLGDQAEFDQFLIDAEGTSEKSRWGANATLAVSLAYARLSAQIHEIPLYQFLGEGPTFPRPYVNVLNGGAHATNPLDIQEFMIVPLGEYPFSEWIRRTVEVFHTLKKVLQDQGISTAVGDEGGVAPPFTHSTQAFDVLMRAIESAGYRVGDDFGIALDVAASAFYREGRYYLEGKCWDAEALTDLYRQWKSCYPILSIEDGMAEDDYIGWKILTNALGAKIQLVGDDIFVTQEKRLRDGIEQGLGNAILIKPNQVGTLSETLRTIRCAQEHHYKIMISHRSGETEDSFIADLSVGTQAEHIKTGSVCRSERTAKYNQLLRLEKEIVDMRKNPLP